MKVLITRPELFHKEGIKLLKMYFEIKADVKGPLNKDQLIGQIGDGDAIILLRSTEIIDKEVIDKAKNLKVISIAGVGYENIDVDYATEKGILVTYCPVHIPTVADNAFGLLLCVSRKISSADAFVKSSKWLQNDTKVMFDFMGFDIHSKTLGIIGLGRIGTEIAKRAKGFDMNVLYYDKVNKDDVEKMLNIRKVSLDHLLRKSDFVVISCSLNKETYHLIDGQKLKLMKASAFIVNTARGGVIDQDALCNALVNRSIAGAGLDVFEREPIEYDEPLPKLDNVVLTPHIGPYTYEAERNMAKVTARNVIKALKGKRPDYVLNEGVLRVRDS